MGSEFIGFRLNYKKDADILDALSNAKDKTKEIKRLMRIAIALPRQVTVEEKPAPRIQAARKPIQKTDNVIANILNGFD
jgi:hypothetical protein